MGESRLTKSFRSEAELTEFAGEFARAARAFERRTLLIGLRGELGSGKTAWTRAMLRGLGYAGRVPSPTYTLLEQYALDGLTVVHLDLYRVASESELEHLGVRDWLGQPAVWVVVEWPERAPQLLARCDLVLTFAERVPGTRDVVFDAATDAGIHTLQHSCHELLNNDR